MSTWPQTRYSLLAQLADASSTAAWREFEQLYQPTIYRYARNRGLQPADALEVVQEVLLAVHGVIGDWRPSHREGSFRAWLAEAARCITLQLLRQKQKSDRSVGGSDFREVLAALPEKLDEDTQFERWAFFTAAAAVENEVQASTWRAFWLTAVEGRSAEAVAGDLGLSVGTVYSAKCRVLARIRRCVEKLSRSES